jgi:hypothetical protein
MTAHAQQRVHVSSHGPGTPLRMRSGRPGHAQSRRLTNTDTCTYTHTGQLTMHMPSAAHVLSPSYCQTCSMDLSLQAWSTKVKQLVRDGAGWCVQGGTRWTCHLKRAANSQQQQQQQRHHHHHTTAHLSCCSCDSSGRPRRRAISR